MKVCDVIIFVQQFRINPQEEDAAKAMYVYYLCLFDDESSIDGVSYQASTNGIKEYCAP